MRVTKTIREFIHEEVKKRIQPRYAAEADAARYQQDVFDKVRKEAVDAASRLYDDMLKEAVDKYEFLKKDPDCKVERRYCNMFSIKDENVITSVHRWQTRMNQEIEKISKEIEVELELGGTKKELMEMLDKI